MILEKKPLPQAGALVLLSLPGRPFDRYGSSPAACFAHPHAHHTAERGGSAWARKRAASSRSSDWISRSKNAGADTWLVRERSMIGYEVVVDNDAGAPGYVETGDWQTSLSPGYGGGTYRFASTLAGGTATATWTPDLPQAGWYAVWAWYRPGDNRTVDARYEVHHAGGVTPAYSSAMRSKG